jgi:hypothetical protein
VTVTNNLLWKQLFAENLRASVPELFHVPGEVLTESLLIEYLRDSEHLFYRILFDRQTRDRIIELFDSVSGCWENHHGRGTHLFWFVNDARESERLWIDHDALITEDGSCRIELTPEKIGEMLQKKQMYPGLFLVYGVIIFYCGIKPLTGGRSTDAIATMKNRWLLFESEELQRIESIPVRNPIQYWYTDNFSLDFIRRGGMNLAFLRRTELFRLNLAVLQRIKRFLGNMPYTYNHERPHCR